MGKTKNLRIFTKQTDYYRTILLLCVKCKVRINDGTAVFLRKKLLKMYGFCRNKRKKKCASFIRTLRTFLRRAPCISQSTSFFPRECGSLFWQHPSEKTPHLRRVIWIFADLIRKMSKLLSASAYFLRYFLFCAVFLDFYILADFLRSFMPEMMNVKNPHVRINAGNPVRVQKSVFFPHVRIFYALADFLRTCGIFTHLRIFYAHAYFPRTYGFS